MTRYCPSAWLLPDHRCHRLARVRGPWRRRSWQVLQVAYHVTVCDVNPWTPCGQVMQTPQSSVFGFPDTFIGIVAFAVIITTAMGILAGARFPPVVLVGLQAGVTLGFASAVRPRLMALYAIHILCPFCM